MSGKYDDAIRRAAEAGMSYGEAADAIGIAPQYVSVRAKSIGVTLRDGRGSISHAHRRNHDRIARIRDLAAQGLSQSTIAIQEGISRERVRQICNRERIDTVPGGPDWDMRDRIAELARDGLCASEIARRLGRDPSVVSAAAKSMGLPLPRFEKPAPVTDRIRQLAASGLTMRETLDVFAEGVKAGKLCIADDMPGFRHIAEVA